MRVRRRGRGVRGVRAVRGVGSSRGRVPPWRRGGSSGSRRRVTRGMRRSGTGRSSGPGAGGGRWRDSGRARGGRAAGRRRRRAPCRRRASRRHTSGDQRHRRRSGRRGAGDRCGGIDRSGSEGTSGRRGQASRSRHRAGAILRRACRIGRGVRRFIGRQDDRPGQARQRNPADDAEREDGKRSETEDHEGSVDTFGAPHPPPGHVDKDGMPRRASGVRARHGPIGT